MKTQLIFINSANRLSGSCYDFLININDGLIKAEENQTINLVVLDVVLNRSWYTVQNSDNTFNIFNGTSTTTYTIPIGYYSVTTLKSTLSTILPGGWIVSYYSTTNKFILTPPSDSKTYTISFINSACYLLGFNLSDVVSGSYSVPISSTIPVKLNRETAVVIHADIARQRCSAIDNFSQVNFYESDILVKIPIQVAGFDQIVYLNNGNDNFSSILSVKEIHTIRFRVTDENDIPLQLPYDWSLTLKLQFIDDDDTTIPTNVEKIKDYLKLIILNDHMGPNEIKSPDIV